MMRIQEGWGGGHWVSGTMGITSNCEKLQDSVVSTVISPLREILVLMGQCKTEDAIGSVSVPTRLST